MENLKLDEFKIDIQKNLDKNETKEDINPENKENLDTEKNSHKSEDINYENILKEKNSMNEKKTENGLARELEFKSCSKNDLTSESESDESNNDKKLDNSLTSSSFGSNELNQNQVKIEFKEIKCFDKKKFTNDEGKFYEKKITEKKEKDHRLENLRKKNEMEAISRTIPIIDSGSKKIMEKKKGFFKPIYERAKEIEISKKNKLDIMKKTVEEKNAKLEEEVLKSKIFITNKPFDEKEFSKWRTNKIEWENKKNLKIEGQKDIIMKQKTDEMSKFYHPNINNKKEINSRSKIDSGVHNKLYSMKDVKNDKLIQKIIESTPDFKPSLNKKLPNYIKKKKEQSENNTFQSNSPKITFKSDEFALNEVIAVNYNSKSKTERKKRNHAVSMNSYHFVIDSEDEIDDDQEPIIVQDNIINQYKQALEFSNKLNFKEVNRHLNKNDNNYNI